MTPQGFKAWRRRMRFTQEQAAEALGITKRAVAAYEGGETQIPTMAALACAHLETKGE